MQENPLDKMAMRRAQSLSILKCHWRWLMHTYKLYRPAFLNLSITPLFPLRFSQPPFVSDPTTVGNRHGVLRDRLERTMNKGTAAALRWAKNKVGTDD